MIKYLAKAKEYSSRFKLFSIKNIPRNMNQKADVLNKLASVAFKKSDKGSTSGGPQRTIHEGPGSTLHSRRRRGQLDDPHQAMFGRRSMDILGPLPPARGGGKFIIVAIDYFTKWIEANPLVKIIDKEVIRFVMDRYNLQFGLPAIISLDNVATVDEQGGSNPQANGLVERANRSLMEGIKTRLGREKTGWVDELPNVLWAHRTSIKQSNGETPFSLTYGSEAVIPAEIGIPTYRTLMIREEYNEEEMRLNLDLLQERRETAAIREARYKTKMEQYYNKKVHPSDRL
ncbi:reverse transcriptase domain-containing protein [Tanacetum coccineum]